MFETIKEFEDYIFSIETEEQLQNAKYGVADIVSFYEKFGDRTRAQIQSDISQRLFEIWRKKNSEFMCQMKDQAIKAFSNPNEYESILIGMGEKTDKEFSKYRRNSFPLIKALNINHMNLEDEGNALMLDFMDIAGNLEDMSDLNADSLSELLMSNPITKDLFQGFNEILTNIVNSNVEGSSIEQRLLSAIFERAKMGSKDSQIEEKIQRVINSKWFNLAIERNFIEIGSSKYLWKGKNQELSLFGELICERLNFKDKWKIVQPIFDKYNLAQYKHKVTGDVGSGKFGPREKEIYKIFDVV